MENYTIPDILSTVNYNSSMQWNSSTPEAVASTPIPVYQWKSDLAGKIRTSFAFITIIVGLVGNSISFRVMTSKAMRVTSAGVYFAAIALSDTATLLTGQLPAILYQLANFDVVNVHYWSCRWFFAMLFTFADTAVWLMLSVTVDRFISVVFPLKRRDLCTPKRAVVCCVSLLGAALLKNLHIFWTRGRQVTQQPDGTYVTTECGFPRPEYEHFETFIRPWLAFTLYAFIPITGLVVLNVSIAVALWRHSKKQENSNNQTDGNNSRASRQAAQLTWMLLTVSVTFTILITPSIVVLIAKPYVATSPARSASYSLLEAVADTLAYVNHSSNFFLYCLSGAGFRKEVKRMFSCGKNRVAPAEVSNANTTENDK